MLRATFVLTLHSLTLAVLPGAAATATTTEPAAAATSPTGYVRPEAPGRMVEVAPGRSLHLDCKGDGHGGPTVVFEAGLSQYAAHSTYGTAQDAIARYAKVCTYDRAGLGWSDPAPADWTQDGMVADLDALLANAGIAGPVVLVGHSLGGLLARSYVRAHPERVAGIALLDATSESDFPELEKAQTSVVAQIDAAIASSQPGQPVIGMPAGTAPEVLLAFTPEVLRGVKVEFEALSRLPAAMKQPGGYGTLGDLPLVVVRRGKTMQPPSADDLAHQSSQEALARLSSQGELVVATHSGHVIPLDEPQVVADVVRHLLAVIAAGSSG